MIFQATEDGGLTNIFKELKSVQTTFEELDKTTLRGAINAFNNTSISVDDLSQSFGGLDDSVVTYLNSTERGQASINGLSNSMYNSANSMSFAATKAKLLAGALNMIIGIGITLAIQGIVWAIDELIVTMDEQKEKLDDAVQAYEESETELKNINDELKTTQERIDELNGKDNLTFTEQDELEKLVKTNDELERKIFLLEQANKEAEKKVVAEAQETYDKYTNNRNIGAKDQIDFYTNSSLLEGVSWDTYKDDLSWLIAQYKRQQELLANAQENGWTDLEEKSRNNLELLEGYMSETSQNYQDLYDKIGGISEYVMTDELKEAQQDLDNILDITAEILGYGGERAKTSFDDIWNSEDFSHYKTELENLSKEGKLDASVLESNENYKKLLENTGATAEDTAQHINALVDEMKQLPNTVGNLDNQTSILSLDEAKVKVEGSDGEDGTLGIKDELELVQQALADTKNVGIDTYQSLIGASNKYSSALKVEAGRVVVDNKRLQQVAKTRAKNTKLEVKEASTLKKLQWIQEARRLQQYNFQQNDLTVGIWETCDALMMEINQFDILTQGIDSATNAFTEFQNAQNMADTGDYFDVGLDMADAYQKALETGKIGTEEFMATMKGFMSAETFANIINLGDTQAQMDALDKFYDDFVSKYFIKGEDQEYDVSGIQNFMKDVAAVVDEEGNHIFATYEDGIFSLVDGMDFESLADHFGANVDMIYALFGELEEYSIGDSFTFTDTNAIDGYYQRLSELTKAQEQYNQAVESGGEYDQILAKKQLQEATERYNDSLDVNIKKFNDIYQTWLQTQDKGTFSDYLSQNMSEGEMLTSYYSLSDKIKEVKKEASLLQKTLVNVPNGSEAYEKYNEQLSALNGELEELNKSKITLEEQDVITEALSKNTKDLKDKTQQYLDCIEILNNKDKKYGQEEIEKAKVGVTDFISLLGNIPEEIRTQLEVEAEAAKAKLQTVQNEIAQIQGNINRTGQTNTSAMMAAQSALNAKQSQASGLEAEIQQIETVLNMDTSAAEAKLAEIQAMNIDKDGTISYSADFSSVAGAKPPELKGTVKYKAEFEDATPPSKNGGGSNTQRYRGLVHGSAHATGTAHSTGDWRVGKTQGKSLIGELGTETLVRNGHYYTIGENGAELIDLQPNDIIFNHKQTEQLFKNGHISSRGRMIGNSYAEGSAFNYYGSGSINFAKKSKYDKRVYNSTRHGVDGGAGDGADDVADAFEELFDWIEIRIERLARVAEKWANRAETAISNSFFNKYYEKESKAILAQMNANSEAMDYYIATANAVGLNEKYAEKVRKGAIDIETITDEELKEKIDLFQQWYEKALSCSDSFEELATALYNIPLDKATSKIEKFNEAIDLLEKKLDNAIGSTAKNKLVEQETKNQKKILEANKTALKESKKNLKSARKSMTSASVLKSSDVSKNEKKKIKDAVKNGKEINLSYFTEGSKAYKAALKYNEALKANAQAQYDLNVATEEYNRWLVEASKIKFDNVADDYEKKIQLLEYQMASYDRSIKEAEATANKINRQYYEAQKGVVSKELADYQSELKDLEESVKDIKPGTDEWFDAKDAIEEVKKAISDCVIETAELNKAINQLYFDAHKNFMSDIDRIIAEQNMLTELSSHEKNADNKTGTFTDAGIANLGSKVAIYELLRSKVDETKNIVDDLRYMIDNNLLSYGNYTFNSDKERDDAFKESNTELQGYITDMYHGQVEVVDLAKERYQAELEMVQQIISDRKEALQAEKD